MLSDMTRMAACILVLFGTAFAAAAQPVSQSMAQCSGLMLAMGDLLEDSDNVRTARSFAGIWTQAALKEAQAEGQADPPAWVMGHIGTMRRHWSGLRAEQVIASDDLRQWAAYCGKIAKTRGLAAHISGR